MRDAIRLRTRTICLLAGLALGGAIVPPPGPVQAQGFDAAADQRPVPPYEAVVDVPEAEVRSGAGRAYYPIAVLPQGTRITVQEEYLNWYRVEVPQQASAYVLAKDVEFSGRQGTGPGRVVADQAYAFHAGLDRGAGTSFKRARVLKKGEKVEVLEVVDDEYLRIRPPAQTRAFLAPGTLRPAPTSEDDPAATAAIAAGPAATPDAVPSSSASPTPPDGGGRADRVTQATATAATPERSTSSDGSTVELTEIVSPTVQDNVAVVDQRVPEQETRLAESPQSTAGRSVVSVEQGSDTTSDPVPGSDARSGPAPREASSTPSPRAVDGGSAADFAALDAAVDAPALADASASTPPPPASTPGAAPAGVDASEDAPPTSPAQSEALRSVEASTLPLFRQPVDRQPLDRMAAAYQGLDAASLTRFDRQLVEARLATIEQNRQRAATLSTIQAARRDLPQLEPLELEDTTARGFEAVGILRASRVFQGRRGGNTPLLFRVVDAGSERTVAYLRPVEGVNAAGQLGALVGIRGTSAYDPSLRTTLITADAITPLAPAGR